MERKIQISRSENSAQNSAANSQLNSPQTAATKPKRVYISYKSDYHAACEKNYLNDNEPEIIELQNGIAVPENAHGLTCGIYDKNFNGIHSDSNTPFFQKPKTIPKLDYIDESVIFVGCSFLHFGHMLFEGLSRLWYVTKNPADKRKLLFVYIGKWGKNTFSKKSYYTFLKFLGVDKSRVIIIAKPTKFRHISAPKVSARQYTHFTKDFSPLYQAFAKGANTLCVGEPIFEKIYLSRAKFVQEGRCFLNEQIYEEFFANLGFKIIYPEDFAVEKMIYLLNNAEQVATTMGTTAHLALFCKPKTKFIILTREAGIYLSSFALTTQLFIHQAMNTNYFIINANANFLPSFGQGTGWGVVNFDFTEDFKEFVAEHFEGDFSEIYAKTREKFLLCDNTAAYLRAFARFFAQPEHFKRVLGGLSAFDFVNKLNEVFFNESLDRALFETNLPNLNSHLNSQSKFCYFLEKKIFHNLFAKPVKWAYKKVIFNLFLKPIFWARKRNLT